MSLPTVVSRNFAVGTALLLFSMNGSVPASASASDSGGLPHNVMPAPAVFEAGAGGGGAGGRVAFDRGFTFAITGHDDARLRDGIARVLRRMEERTGFILARGPVADAATAVLVVDCAAAGNAIPAPGEDESYELTITPAPARIALRAGAVVGILRGLETLSQLLASDVSAAVAAGWSFPAVTVRDAPRFPWRGLLVDVCRHWQPTDVIQRTLDGMALVKLNVLHLHVTEDQGFRIESRLHPRLHELGSDGNYFTQDEIREIIAYAAARGIRVVPEFDIPGHATSWLVGHPELGSQPGPYEIERRWGIFDPALDPTNDAVYELLGSFLGEMAALFPDPYLHIGGDENNGKHWDANPRIQAFKRERGLADNEHLQAHFNTRVLAILTKHGKRMVGWDEILHPDLPKQSVIHSWRGPEGLAAAARGGYATILSNGYYIDLSHPTTPHYLNDPLPAGTPLTAEEQKRVLGGEATMWAEWVTPETIDSRIWPRTAAIAERLWSPREVRDISDMYRRLDIVSRRLEEAGLRHLSYIEPMIRRFAGDDATPDDRAALRALADLVEPVKGYRRGREQPGSTQFTPLTGLVDFARPDSAPSRAFAGLVEAALFSPEPGGAKLEEIRARLAGWRAMADGLERGLAQRSPRVRALAPLLQRVKRAAEAGDAAVRVLTGNAAAPPPVDGDALLRALAEAGVPHDACELPIIPALRLLVAAAALQSERSDMTAAEWRSRVEELAAPPAEQRPAAPAH